MDFQHAETLRRLDWVTRHEILEILESWASNPLRKATVMRLIKTMGPDELLQGMDNAILTHDRTIIPLPNKTPMQITLPELFKRQRRVR